MQQNGTPDHNVKQSFMVSDASSVRSQYSSTISLKQVSTPVNLKTKKQLIGQSLKTFRDMKVDNKHFISRLSMKYELIEVLLSTQQIYYGIKRFIESKQKYLLKNALQNIEKQANENNSFCRTSQRNSSVGIVNNDQGVERLRQNEQLLRIIQNQQKLIGFKNLQNIQRIINHQFKKLAFVEIQEKGKRKLILQQLIGYRTLLRLTYIFDQFKSNKQSIQLKILQGSETLVQYTNKKQTIYLLNSFQQLKSQEKPKKSKNVQISINGIPLINNYKDMKLCQVLNRLFYADPYNRIKQYQMPISAIPSDRLPIPSLKSLQETHSRQMSFLNLPADTSHKLEESVMLEPAEVSPFVASETKGIQLKKKLPQRGKLIQNVKEYLTQKDELQYTYSLPQLEQTQSIEMKEEHLQKKVINRRTLQMIGIVGILILMSAFYFLY